MPILLIEWTLTLGDLIVELGTLLLALVTWRLARSTAASADIEWAFSVALTNLGSGPAILDGIHPVHEMEQIRNMGARRLRFHRKPLGVV